jgi:rhamnogalacturonyl hydrolase YesR
MKRILWVLVLLPLFGSGCIQTKPISATWDDVPMLLKRINPPTFPVKDFSVTDFGAVGDGQTSCTKAFSDAIAACHKAGGGRVIVPAGQFLTGPIHLKSKVNLYLEKDAVITFSQNPKDYLPVVLTRWEGVEVMGYSPLVYAYKQKDIAITGQGTLIGGGDKEHWWPWSGKASLGWKEGIPTAKADRDKLMKMNNEGVPVKERVFGEGSLLRPMFIQFHSCKNILIEGVTVRNGPMWNIHPLMSQNITVRNVQIIGHGPNNDGCDPESCKDVLIENCLFDTGDDCIAIKAGRNRDGRRINVPSENIIVQGCTMKDGHGGVTIGSEISGGARNIFARDCRMDSPNLDRALRLKTNAMRGGVIENVYMKDVQVGQVADAVVSINYFYEEGPKGDFMPIVRNIEARDMTCRNTKYAVFLRGFENDPIRDVRVINCVFEKADKPSVVENVEGLVFENVMINGQLQSAGDTEKKNKLQTIVEVTPWSVRMAESVMKRNPDAWATESKWTYTQGLINKALWQVCERTGQEKYCGYVNGYYDEAIDEQGNIKTYKLLDYNIDNINPGMSLLALYKKNPQPKYAKAIALLRQQMKDHPRTKEGGFWHKKRYPWQMWLDGLYMGSPFLTSYAVQFNEPALFDEVCNQIVFMERHARDSGTGLLYHGWDESRQQKWSNPETGCSPHFWGRAMGWYSMALVDVLDYLPKDHPRRGEIVAVLQRLAKAVAAYQDKETGVWYQIVDQGDREGNYLESSASSMFTYMLLKAVRFGYIDSSYLSTAEKGYNGILKQFIEVADDGQVHILKGCSVAGLGGNPYRDGSYTYYISEKIVPNDPKAVGPFILASLERESMAKK